MMITTAAEAMTAVETKVFKENSNASIFELAFFLRQILEKHCKTGVNRGPLDFASGHPVFIYRICTNCR